MRVTLQTSDFWLFAQAEYSEELRTLLRSLGWVWERGWYKHINQYTGSRDDRLAETAQVLKKAGFEVNAPDWAFTRQFVPECRQWILSDKKGWALKWEGYDNPIYHEACGIPGAKWRKPYLRVPTASAEELRDFAQVHGFKFSEDAQKSLDEAIASLDAGILGTQKLPKAPPLHHDFRPSRMEPVTAEIAEELLDDPF